MTFTKKSKMKAAEVTQALARVADAALEEDVRLQQLHSLADAIASAADTWQLDSQVSSRSVARHDDGYRR